MLVIAFAGFNIEQVVIRNDPVKPKTQDPFNTTGEVLLLALDWNDLTISRTAYIILL